MDPLGENKIPPQVTPPINPATPVPPPAQKTAVPSAPSVSVPQKSVPKVEPAPKNIPTMAIPTGNDLPVGMSFRAELPDDLSKPVPQVEPAPLAQAPKPPAPAQAPATPKPSVPGSPPEQKKPPETYLQSLRTFKSDVAQSVKNQKTSLVRMVMAEEARKQTLADIDSPASKRNVTFIAAGVILIALGAGGAFYFYQKNQSSSAGVPAGTKETPLLFAEKSKNISVTGLGPEAIVKTAGEEVLVGNTKLDTIENITFSEKVGTSDVGLSTQRMFFFLDHRMPPTLLRSLNRNFMFGVHTFNGNHPFLVFGTNFYENTFAGMLAWEKYLARDLLGLFALKKAPEDPVYNRSFEDRTIKNWDARVLPDDDGTPALFYVFKDKQTVIITNSEQTLEEVIRRLNSSNPVFR